MELLKNKISNECVFVGFIMPKEVATQVFKFDPNPAVQTHKFGIGMLGVLSKAFKKINAVGFCAVQDYPRSSKAFFGFHKFKVDNVEGRLLPFINFLLLKHFSRAMLLLLYLFPALLTTRKTYIIHGLHTPYLLLGFLLSTIGNRVGIVLTDESSLVLPSDNAFRKLLKIIDSKIICWLVRRFDFGIALSDFLVEKYLLAKPAFLLPGIVSADFLQRISCQSSSKKTNQERSNMFVLCYAGGLSAEYGVSLLIDAILLCDFPIQLRVFGRGDQEERLIRLSKDDSRFFYGGFIEGERLIHELVTADLLVNPRPSDSRLAKMSSASKVFEYAATGRPLLTTKLPTIPRELEEVLFFIDEESPKGILSALRKVMGFSSAQLTQHGSHLQLKTVENYSDVHIARRLVCFLNTI